MGKKIQGFTVVAYPESMPPDYQIRLGYLPFGYCSALHDKDTDENGKLKKAHIHFFFQGRPTIKQKEYIYASLNISYGQDVHSASGMYDYMTHERESDKHHYPKDIIQHSAKWSQEIFETELAKEPKDHTFEVIEYIETNDIREYRDLMLGIHQDGLMMYEDTCKKYFIMRYIDSRRNIILQNELKNKENNK